MDYPSMENYLGPLYSTNGSSNYYGYSNPEFDKLVKEGAARQDAGRGDQAKYQQAEDILAKDMPVIPLRFGQNIFGHSTKVKNVEMDLFHAGQPRQDRSGAELRTGHPGDEARVARHRTPATVRTARP